LRGDLRGDGAAFAGDAADFRGDFRGLTELYKTTTPIKHAEFFIKCLSV